RFPRFTVAFPLLVGANLSESVRLVGQVAPAVADVWHLQSGAGVEILFKTLGLRPYVTVLVPLEDASAARDRIEGGTRLPDGTPVLFGFDVFWKFGQPNREGRAPR